MLHRVVASPSRLLTRGIQAATGQTLRALALSIPLLAGAASLNAQTGTVTGRVRDARTAATLSGAQSGVGPRADCHSQFYLVARGDSLSDFVHIERIA